MKKVMDHDRFIYSAEKKQRRFNIWLRDVELNSFDKGNEFFLLQKTKSGLRSAMETGYIIVI